MAEVLSEAAALGLVWGRADGKIVSRSAFVEEARSWVGTKFRHQHERKGHGVDCGGLIRGSSVELGLIPTDYFRLIPPSIRAYARQPNGDLGKQLCDHYWREIEIDSAVPGDLILIKYAAFPQHAAVLGDYIHGGLSMIHALGPGHPGKVVEHRLDSTWRARIVAAYSVPGVG